jgi:hypothetical protein
MKPSPIALAIMHLYGGISIHRLRYGVGELAYIKSGGPFGFGRGVK